MYGPATFATKADANQWLSTVQTDVARGDHLDPAGNDILFEEFATAWLADKRALRPKTVELYSHLLNCHLLPTFGPLPLARIDTTLVRRWHAATLSGHLSQSTVAKTYRLLRQILETAIDDHLIRQNPCRLKGAATEKTIERTIPTLAQVHALADAIDPRYRAMVWLGALGGLRKGECHGLARRHIIDDGATVSIRVERALVETQRHGLLIQEPKTEAGRRTVALPSFVAEEVRTHLERFVGAQPDALVFTAAHDGGPVNKTVWRNAWQKARLGAHVDCTFHDLRHFAGTMNAAAGATTKEAMARLGHASPDASLRYQHVIQGRDSEIANAVDALIRRG
ncbi:MAG: site-specific integrase [Acidimicrobiales bacterium]